MTTINKNYELSQQQFGGVPFGNQTVLFFNFTTNASGVLVDSDLTTAIQSGDIVRLGVLPAGFKLVDDTVIISDAFSASTTASLGFQYVDGVDVTATPQSATYFASAVASDATSVARKTEKNAPITLPKAAYLILTVGGAAHGSVGIMDIMITGVLTGVN